MIVFDTTVLVYAVGAEHPLRHPSRRLVEAVGDGRLEATTTVEVIHEFVHVRARRRGRSDAAERGRELLRLLGPLVTPGDAELAAALQMFGTHERLGMFDAVLAATAMACGAEALVSADQAFADVPGLTYLDLAGPQVLRLVES